jgi:hypothetical protein
VCECFCPFALVLCAGNSTLPGLPAKLPPNSICSISISSKKPISKVFKTDKVND